MASNRMYLLSMLIFPVFVTVFFTSFMHEGQPENMPVGVVDLDNTTTTRKLTRMLDSFQSSEVVAHYPSVEEARQAMQRGDIYGFLYFPKETTAKLLASRQPHVSYYYSYATLTSGALVFKDLKTVSTLGSAGVAKSVMSAKGYTDGQIMAFLQPISIDLHTVGNPWVNYNIYLSTMLVPTCLLLLIFLITAYAMGMLPHIAVWLLVMGAYMVYTFGVLHFPHPGGWGVIVLLAVLSVLASVGFGVFMFGLLPALRMSMSICSLWGVLSFSMVGTAFPVLAMDAPLQVLANIFPMRHFFLIYETCIFADNPLSDVALNIAALVLFAAAPVFVVLRINRAYKEYVYME